jgi:hypothetical protein
LPDLSKSIGFGLRKLIDHRSGMMFCNSLLLQFKRNAAYTKTCAPDTRNRLREAGVGQQTLLLE